MNSLNKSEGNNRKKTVLIGLDGVPHSMLLDLKKRGRIPNMSSLFETGYFGKMSVCIPEISSVSWTSLMTGMQPGDHGIYGFIDLQPNSYMMRFPNYADLKVPTLWDELATRGKKSVVINMPATYPARKINGALISGFVAIDINKAVYPTSVIPKLKKFNYRIDVDTAKARFEHDYLFQELDDTLDSRKKAIDLLWRKIDWDLFAVVITGTDRLMHFLWEAYDDPNHIYHQQFLDYFTKVDEFVGWMMDRIQSIKDLDDSQKNLFILSDHGFTGIKTEVYLNHWLQENGYLKYKKEKPETIMDIGADSRAFALDPSRIHINLKNKYPLGTVDNSDYENVRQEIKTGIESLSFDNNPIVKKIYFREELFFGPYLENGPDLVVLSNHGYDLKGRVNSDAVFEKTDLSGMHTQDDAFFFNSAGLECKTIFDVRQAVISSLN